MSHAIIVGMTGSGKTTLGKSFIRQLKVLRKPTAVLDPMEDHRWQCDFKTADLGRFHQHVSVRTGLYLAIDEGATFGKFNDEVTHLMTKGRHLGHNVFLITQELTQVSPLIRGQCETLYLFGTGERAVKLVAEEWRCKELLRVPPLGRGEFFKVSKFSESSKLSKYSIDFKTGKCYRA